jgi:hypothetical protein
MLSVKKVALVLSILPLSTHTMFYFGSIERRLPDKNGNHFFIQKQPAVKYHGTLLRNSAISTGLACLSIHSLGSALSKVTIVPGSPAHTALAAAVIIGFGWVTTSGVGVATNAYKVGNFYIKERKLNDLELEIKMKEIEKLEDDLG